MRSTRLIAVAVVLLGLTAGGCLLWQRFASAQPTHLMTAEVARGDVEETVLATGTLKPARLVAVGAQASGRITSVNVALGDRVKAGDLIAEIDSTTQQNDLRTAEAALANVKAQSVEKQATLALNEQNLRRQKDMVAKRAVSQAEYDSAAADLNVTRAQIVAIEAQIREAEVAVETAKANLGYTRITAPIDGTVLAIVNQEGQTVNATQSAPTIVVLGQLDTMTVRTELSEADVIKVKPGQPLWFTILGDADRRYEAKLESIEPAPESITKDSSITSSSSTTASSDATSSDEAIYYNGIFNVPNPDGNLRTYMTAQVHIVLREAKDVPMVSAAALQERNPDGSYTVRVMAPDGSVFLRKIEIGLNNKITAEVRSGLEEGERVVTGEMTAPAPDAMPGGRGGPPPIGF
ncbi:efflux RND transporter periplasmic adaptor subunit [Sinorhizobium meliloti]|uniref:efflux RND transporter periplasmic adaptor subunit n=1 Tax=Rhizobium meliloti TaxID=382 RepID=UPI003F17698E